MVVGQHCVIGDAEKVDVPDVGQRCQQGRVGFGWRLTEVAVHGMGAVEKRLEVGFADADGDRSADGRPQREPSPHPVPHREDVLRPQAPGRGGLRPGGDGDELGGHRLAAVGALQQPVAGRGRVGQGLQGGEGLGDDDEQRGFRVRAGQGVGDGVAVNVGDEAEGQRAVRVPQRFDGQFRAELGAADADVDHPLKCPA